MCDYCKKTICPAGCPNNDEAAVCENCGKHILRGEVVYEVGEDCYCEDCAATLTIEDLVKCGSAYKETA